VRLSLLPPSALRWPVTSPAISSNHRLKTSLNLSPGIAKPYEHAANQGLALAHFRAQREDLRDTCRLLELNLSIFGTHPRVNVGHMGDKVSLS